MTQATGVAGVKKAGGGMSRLHVPRSFIPSVEKVLLKLLLLLAVLLLLAAVCCCCWYCCCCCSSCY